MLLTLIGRRSCHVNFVTNDLHLILKKETVNKLGVFWFLVMFNNRVGIYFKKLNTGERQRVIDIENIYTWMKHSILEHA